jgi:hypothetical protein
MSPFTESIVEDATLGWLASLGYSVLHGLDIAAAEPAAERSDPNYRDVVLEGRASGVTASGSGLALKYNVAMQDLTLTLGAPRRSGETQKDEKS